MKKYLLSLILAGWSFTLLPGQTVPPVNFRYAARVAIRAVVSIESDAITGSGVIISDSGYIVTNFHVVDHGVTIRVTLHDKRNFRATVVGLDEPTGVALLRIDAAGLPFLHFAPSGSVEVGDVILAVGHPFELPETVTMGIVSANDRTVDWRVGGNAAGAFLQTDAVVNPGGTGGVSLGLPAYMSIVSKHPGRRRRPGSGRVM